MEPPVKILVKHKSKLLLKTAHVQWKGVIRMKNENSNISFLYFCIAKLCSLAAWNGEKKQLILDYMSKYVYIKPVIKEEVKIYMLCKNIYK